MKNLNEKNIPNKGLTDNCDLPATRIHIKKITNFADEKEWFWI